MVPELETEIVKLRPIDCRAHANDSALWQSGHAMLDGVFDEGLNEHRWDAGVERARIQRALEAQAILEAHALERQIFIDDRQFLGEAHRVPAIGLQRIAKQVRKAGHHRRGALGILGDQRSKRIQAVEEEMRIHLRAQHVELGVARVERQFELTRVALPAGVEREVDHEPPVERPQERDEHPERADPIESLVAGNETCDDEHQRRYADCQEERGGDRAWKTRDRAGNVIQPRRCIQLRSACVSAGHRTPSMTTMLRMTSHRTVANAT